MTTGNWTDKTITNIIKTTNTGEITARRAIIAKIGIKTISSALLINRMIFKVTRATIDFEIVVNPRWTRRRSIASDNNCALAGFKRNRAVNICRRIKRIIKRHAPIGNLDRNRLTFYRASWNNISFFIAAIFKDPAANIDGFFIVMNRQSYIFLIWTIGINRAGLKRNLIMIGAVIFFWSLARGIIAGILILRLRRRRITDRLRTVIDAIWAIVNQPKRKKNHQPNHDAKTAYSRCRDHFTFIICHSLLT